MDDVGDKISSGLCTLLTKLEHNLALEKASIAEYIEVPETQASALHKLPGRHSRGLARHRLYCGGGLFPLWSGKSPWNLPRLASS